jgi:TetR/AcrR family transcriptional regulator, transcriptional repressor for nem operon
MRKSKQEAAVTRQRIIRAAAAAFRKNGIAGTGLSDLMAAAGLTHGGFYRHFDSRDELVTEALELALTETGQAMRERLLDGDKANLAAFVDFYLDEAHRDQRAAGCAVAALAADAPRKSADVQVQFRRHIERNLETMSDALRAGGSTDDARAVAILVLSALYGALIMARAVGDSPLSSEVLRTVRKRVMSLSGPVKKPRTRTKLKK